KFFALAQDKAPQRVSSYLLETRDFFLEALMVSALLHWIPLLNCTTGTSCSSPLRSRLYYPAGTSTCYRENVGDSKYHSMTCIFLLCPKTRMMHFQIYLE